MGVTAQSQPTMPATLYPRRQDSSRFVKDSVTGGAGSGEQHRFFADGAGNLSYSYDGSSAHLVTLAHVTNHNVAAGDIHVVA